MRSSTAGIQKGGQLCTMSGDSRISCACRTRECRYDVLLAEHGLGRFFFLFVLLMLFRLRVVLLALMAAGAALAALAAAATAVF